MNESTKHWLVAGASLAAFVALGVFQMQRPPGTVSAEAKLIQGDVPGASLALDDCASDAGALDRDRLRCIARLAEFETGEGKLTRARARLDEALALLELDAAVVDGDTRAALLSTACFNWHRLGDDERALAAGRAGLSAAQSPHARGMAMLRLSDVAPIAERESLLREARTIFRELDPHGFNYATATLALAERLRADPVQAEPLFDESIAVYERNSPDGGHPILGVAHCRRGALKVASGRVDGGIEDLQLGLVLERAGFGENSPFVVDALCELGFAYRKTGERQRANEVLSEGVALAARIHLRSDRCLNGLALVARDLGDYERARELLVRLRSAIDSDPPSPERTRDLEAVNGMLSRLDAGQ